MGELRILDLDALADPTACTVVFMGKRTFPALADALIARGLDPETPAMLAEAGEGERADSVLALVGLDVAEGAVSDSLATRYLELVGR